MLCPLQAPRGCKLRQTQLPQVTCLHSRAYSLTHKPDCVTFTLTVTTIFHVCRTLCTPLYRSRMGLTAGERHVLARAYSLCVDVMTEHSEGIY
jgi:hypothetical protein